MGERAFFRLWLQKETFGLVNTSKAVLYLLLGGGPGRPLKGDLFRVTDCELLEFTF
jgi:hypothetical protein